MIRKLILLFLCVPILQSCKEDRSARKDNQSSKYTEPIILPGMEHGLIQPPVKIMSSKSDSLSYQIQLAGDSSNMESTVKGKFINVQFAPESPLLVNESEVEYRQMHFYTPALHLVEGEQYPVEFQVITAPVNSFDQNPEYLVVSILFKIGEANQFIQELLQKLVNYGGNTQESQLNILLGGRAMVNKTNEDLNGFYHYIGPLATKPYSKSVHWYIARRIFEISNEQMETIKSLKEQARP